MQAILFAAPTCELVSAAAVGSGLGPDILAAELDVAEVVARARATSHRTVAELLLDQGVCAGVGNIFRCDTLWHERVDPMAPPSAFDDTALARLYIRARDLMRRAAIGDGFRSRQAVHGLAGRPCTTCGTLIRARALGRPSRILFWCPRCQGSDGRQHPERDHDPLQQGSGEHQRVEDLVEAERVRPRVGALERVDDGAADVHRPAERE